MNNNAIEYYKSIASEMETFCKPLNDYFGIPFFAYFKVYKDASYIFLSNNYEVSKQYCSKIEYDVIYFQNFLKNEKNGGTILWPEKPYNAGMQLISNLGYWNGMSVVTQQDSNYIEAYIFISSRDNLNTRNFFIRNNEVLKKFALHFKIINKDLIGKSEQYKAQYRNGHGFYIPEHEFNNINVNAFMQKTGINNGIISKEGKFLSLTGREKQCLELLGKGFSSKLISRELSVASKTVEVYLNNIKNKVGFYNRADLIKMYRWY